MHHFLTRVVFANQPKVVAANVENHTISSIAQHVSTVECIYYVAWLLPVRPFDQSQPNLKPSSALCILLDKVCYGLPFDQMESHTTKLNHYWFHKRKLTPLSR